MINTYNESDLHLTLKKIYALETNGKTEVPLAGTSWICDILDENGNAVEIQTSNLSALTEKAEYILGSGKKIKIVHPVLQEKFIEMTDAGGNTIYRKKSPKKATIYDSLRGMTKICTLFLNPNCTLEVLFVRATEIRRQTEKETQIFNKSRRHLKNWVPAGKRLDEILSKKTFTKPSDFTNLLCGAEKTESGLFRLCDVSKAVREKYGARNARWANLLVWILLKMDLIEIKEIRGRSKFYQLTEEKL